MDTGRWLTAMALTLFLAEGFALSVFPRQFRQLIIETDPRWLQMAGLAETAVAAALIAGMMAAR